MSSLLSEKGIGAAKTHNYCTTETLTGTTRAMTTNGLRDTEEETGHFSLEGWRRKL